MQLVQVSYWVIGPVLGHDHVLQHGSMGGSATAACQADSPAWAALPRAGSPPKHFNDAIALAGAEVLY